MFKSNRLAILFALLAILAISMTALTACGGDDDDDDDDHDDDHGDDDDEDPAEHACNHAADGPFVDVDATETEDGAPDVSEPHTAFNVTCTAIDGGNGGFVSYEADEDGEFIFFLGADVTFAVLDAEGIEVDSEHGGPVDACDELTTHYAYDLEVGTYSLSFGPDEVTSVLLVPYEGGDHHHDE